MSAKAVSQKHRDAKNELIALSVKARQLQSEIEALQGVRLSINEILLSFYKLDGHGDSFKTFDEWSRAGWKVKKNEKGLKIWGSKRAAAKRPQSQEESESDEAADYQFFPICYVFSDKQVEKRH